MIFFQKQTVASDFLKINTGSLNLIFDKQTKIHTQLNFPFKIIKISTIQSYINPMSTYAQTYTSLLDKISKKYLPYSNLLQLKNYRSKVNCYKEHSKEADLYYECFQKAELKIAEENQAFTKNYHFLEDQYKTCEQNCTASFTGEADIKNCSAKCSDSFSKGTLELYDNFYRTQLSAEPEYKKIRK